MAKSATQILKEESKNISISKGNSIPPRPKLLTGIAAADYALDGGIPRGSITHAFGIEASHKTNFALKCIASAQSLLPDRVNVFIDLEDSFNSDWAESMGVDTSKLEVVVPDYAEQAADIIAELALSDDLGVMVVDSLAAFQSQNEAESSVAKMNVGGNSMIITQLTKKLVNNLAQHKHEDVPGAVILLNQMRYKIGVIHGNPENAPGGKALAHYAHLNLRFSSKKVNDSKLHPTLPVWAEVKVGLKKWKMSVNDQQFEYKMTLVDTDLGPAGTIFNAKAVLSRLKQHGLLIKEKDGYTVEGVNVKGRTQTDLQKQITKDPELYKTLMGALGIQV